jgi:hypothetical protein
MLGEPADVSALGAAGIRTRRPTAHRLGVDGVALEAANGLVDGKGGAVVRLAFHVNTDPGRGQILRTANFMVLQH